MARAEFKIQGIKELAVDVSAKVINFLLITTLNQKAMRDVQLLMSLQR